jgi:dinuclear metal center YbgI/SA1388 family protein
MKISEIITCLELLAPLSLQETFDNAGLLAGEPHHDCSGVVCSLDLTEEVIEETMVAGANLIVTHHPIVFKPLKSLSSGSYAARCLIKAIKNDIAIYAVHTNYDNVLRGVNLALAEKIGLERSTLKILAPVAGKLAKLYTYVPTSHAEALKQGLFEAGAGHIGLYHECSFSTSGTGTFKPMEGTHPFIGSPGGDREYVEEEKIEFIFPFWLKNKVLAALRQHHPYEEIAYEMILTENEHQEAGSGMIGQLATPLNEKEFLSQIKNSLGISIIRHSPVLGHKIKTVAICGGAGGFLIHTAMGQKADAYLTADLKYHDFFEPDQKMLLLDIGHYESEIPAVSQLTNYLQEKFPTFAVLQTKVDTNPVQYYMD